MKLLEVQSKEFGILSTGKWIPSREAASFIGAGMWEAETQGKVMLRMSDIDVQPLYTSPETSHGALFCCRCFASFGILAWAFTYELRCAQAGFRLNSWCIIFVLLILCSFIFFINRDGKEPKEQVAQSACILLLAVDQRLSKIKWHREQIEEWCETINQRPQWVASCGFNRLDWKMGVKSCRSCSQMAC